LKRFLSFVFLVLALFWAGFARGGEKERTAEAWEEALKFYRDAEIEKPESPELSYNLGNVMYQQEKYQDGMERYFRALGSDDVGHQAWSYYNLGNTLYRSGKYPEAIQAYQKCLELAPEDEDAKYNLEFVRKKMKEMLDKEAQREQNQQGQKQQQNQPQQEEQQQQEQKEQQQDQNQPAQSEEEQREEERKQEQLKQQEGMTEEDAERILNALRDDEKESLREKRKASQRRGRRGGKDW
jgi:Ca-activated chloride channel family protein